LAICVLAAENSDAIARPLRASDFAKLLPDTKPAFFRSLLEIGYDYTDSVGGSLRYSDAWGID
jgi:hypothetical protein